MVSQRARHRFRGHGGGNVRVITAPEVMMIFCKSRDTAYVASVHFRAQARPTSTLILALVTVLPRPSPVPRHPSYVYGLVKPSCFCCKEAWWGTVGVLERPGPGVTNCHVVYNFKFSSPRRRHTTHTLG